MRQVFTLILALAGLLAPAVCSAHGTACPPPAACVTAMPACAHPVTPAGAPGGCCSTLVPIADAAASRLAPDGPPAPGLGFASAPSILPDIAVVPPHIRLPDRDGTPSSAPLYILHSALLA